MRVDGLIPQPREWQCEALAAWEANCRRGIASVVTGGGKTIFAILCIEAIKRHRVQVSTTILVPTIALMDQWYANIRAYLDISADQIALFAGSTKTVRTKQVNIVVLNTGRELVQEITKRVPSFLIVDECHRAASPMNSKALRGNHIATLGLSATPESCGESRFRTVLIPRLGKIIYTYDLMTARADGVISDFSLTNVAVDLSETERYHDAQVTKRIANLHSRCDRGEPLEHQLQLARIRRANIRKNASIRIPLAVRLAEEANGARCIIFHESIGGVDQIARLLVMRGRRATAYHSRLGPELRTDNLRQFAQGRFDILVACRAIDEGLDVPAAQIAIIASSTKQNRQRIQRIGRVLRPSETKVKAEIFTIYIRNCEEEYLLDEMSQLDGHVDVRWMRAEQLADSS